jgi:hypothetical protein
MVITTDFVQSEMTSLEQEIVKAKDFISQAQGAISAYKTILQKLEQPEPDAPAQEV